MAEQRETEENELNRSELIVVGLGPGRWDDLTLAARRVLEDAGRVVVRTLRHPTVDALLARRPGLAVESFDALYEQAESFDALYPRMAERLLKLAVEAPDGTPPLVYAVPGHPLIAEASVRALRERAPAAGVAVRIVPGLSFLEPVSDALDLDPLARDAQLVDATQLAALSGSRLSGAILPTHPLLIAQAYNRRLLSGVKLALLELYPEDWEVAVVRWAGLPEQAVERVPLVELDRDERADHLTTIYVPPLAPLAAARVPEGLRYVVQRLRAPDGCPWDREQTHQSLRAYVLEEAYEVADILDEWQGTPEQAEHLAEELGDLLLQVYLQAEIADQEDRFHIGDVYQGITEKLIRRHPHVFGDVEVRDSAHVLRNWEVIKRGEREAKGEEVAAESALRGVPNSLPALQQAYELGKKAAKTGFDWPEAGGALAKVEEEAHELAAAAGADEHAEQEAELGDLLFALVALARHLHLNPEDALRAANRRFHRRFEAMEARARDEGRALDTLTLDDWLRRWDQAKAATAPAT